MILEEKIVELSSMKKYPKQLFYDGNLELLNRKKVSIVGSRRPSTYSRIMISKLSSELSKHGVVVVSGGAMGIDAIAHNGAGTKNTISVLPCGIDIRYPSVNKNLLNNIQKDGLLLSQFSMGEKSRAYTFVLRNEIVVALGDVLIVGEAELDSGTMRSVEFALDMGKDIYVLSQRIGESQGTNQLLQDEKAKVIYDIKDFVESIIGKNLLKESIQEDEFLLFCSSNPSYEDLLKEFPEKTFEAELNGDIKIINAKIYINA